MAPVTLRPTIAADLSHVIGEPLPFRIRAITAIAGDAVIGVGGLAFSPDGTVWAFVQQTQEAKRYKVAFHRAGLMAMRMVAQSGVREVLATADADNAVARRWLERLGFVEANREDFNGQVLFVWRSRASGAS
jgi:RimJ/RimL family protein N-acetyltransferase